MIPESRGNDVKPDNFTILIALKACEVKGASSLLIKLYSKCGEMSEAVKVFDEFPQPDVFLWTSMVTGYEQNGDPEEALEFFSRIMMAGSVKTAARLFMKMPEKDVVSWSSIIACYVHSGDVTEALNLFNDMIDMRIEPNSVTLVSALQACALAGNLEEGKKIHDIATRKCFELDIKVATALIDMYMKCSAPEKAGVLFNRMPKKDVVSWAALLSGYAHNGMAYKSIGVFGSMLSHET
ncbi:hypothetical protein DVH24_037313 [Malus domestica]|uniref:Pentacotripeptide-repeat region of PRORP domain-containing protein n=1 Tax=Malus domestica TaxID=3750 RepID=A0A498HEV0_MALDO|nr:hypothetical protein DVH24_037313 [Malus domestica]